MQIKSTWARFFQGCLALLLLVSVSQALQTEESYPEGEFISASLATGWIATNGRVVARSLQQPQTEPDYPHGEFEAGCGMCHGPEGWSPAQIGPDFDHGLISNFELDGSHRDALCRSCHLSLEFNDVDTDCASCHQDVHAGEFGTECSDCHTTANFIDRAEELRSHRLSRFPLTGAHVALGCESCHELQSQGGLRFINTPTDCVACHREVFQATSDPNHVALGFDEDCTRCHTPTAWEAANFDHGATGFPLAGAHAALTCENCHVGGQFSGTQAQCVSCHQTDFTSTTDPDHNAAGFPTDCQQCHTTTTWVGAEFDHALSGFPLTGGHTAVTCAECHTSGSFGTIPSTCVSCHQSDYDQQPVHVASGFPTSCENCHTINAWTGATFDHSTFPVTGAHVPLTCQQCHTTGTYAPMPSDCVDCHRTDYDQQPIHVSSGFPTTCEDCHTTSVWTGAAFDHATFPITGAHVPLTCQQCHTTGTYAPMPSECVDCHQTDYDQAPSHTASNFSQTCETCHSDQAWTDATFDHGFFPLAGAHQGAACSSCHTSGVYQTIPNTCVDCHQTDYNEQPNHAASGFPTSCEDCHTVNTWTGATFDHSTFPITGAHVPLTCQQCHTSGTYEPMPSACVDCHQTDYDQAPSHTASNFSQTCETCHSDQTWTNATFDHGFFPLSGAHNGAACSSCHTSGVYQTIPNTCVDCHQTDYNQQPTHTAGGFPNTCEDCHTVNTWTGATFDHATFPITGAHVPLTCEQCHTTGTYGPMPSECIDCHQTDYDQAPSHTASNFSQSCETCHSDQAWTNATFDHGFFPLSGAHNAAACVDCHTSGVYQTIPNTCIDCHQTDYNAQPNHAASGFPTTCEDCHNLNTWTGATFDHSAFPITGAHVPLTCQQCHTTGTYGTIPNNCINCHQVDYVAAPSHTASNFSQNCLSCHTDQTWTNATFDHSFFPLTGAHTAATCADCHTSGVYQTIPSECVDCHLADFQGAPSHPGNFPQTCEDCHTNNTWLGATFDHSTFPITGAHVPLTCDQCHTTGTYGTIPSECVDCHLSDFQAAPGHPGAFPQTCETCHTTTTFVGGTFDHSLFPTTGGHSGLQCIDCHTSGNYGTIPANCVSCHLPDYQGAPDHATLNFSTDCEQCHTVTTWLSTTFVHSFPIVGGPHGGRQCTECHVTGTTADFSCDGACHQHTQSEMDDDHSGETGYAYQFQLCLNCHPNGRS